MNKLKILLVDDEEEFVSTLAERLELRDMVTFIAKNGDEALELIEKEMPPVVILDVMMPGMGGLDVLNQIKRVFPNTQVILLTGHGSTKDGIKGMRLGAFDYLMKPVKIDSLVLKVKEAAQVKR